MLKYGTVVHLLNNLEYGHNKEYGLLGLVVTIEHRLGISANSLVTCNTHYNIFTI